MDDQARAAIRQIARDIAELALSKDRSKTTLEVYTGMNLALARIYEQYQKEDMRIAGPKKILAWATNIGEHTHKRITLN